jgi:hypothetical protein
MEISSFPRLFSYHVDLEIFTWAQMPGEAGTYVSILSCTFCTASYDNTECNTWNPFPTEIEEPMHPVLR